MKKQRCLVLLISLLCLLSGCSETDPDARVLKLGAGIVDHVGLASIEAPEEADIYLVEYKELDSNEVASGLMMGDIQVWKEQTTETRGQTEKTIFVQAKPDENATAERLLLTPEKGMISYDVSKVTPEGEVEGYVYESEDEDAFYQSSQIQEFYHTTLRMPDKVADDMDGRRVREMAEKYFSGLGITDYELDAMAIISDKNQISTDYYMTWRQMVDNIPVSQLEITDGMASGRRKVYNSYQGFDHQVSQVGVFGEGTLLTAHITDGRLTSLDVTLVDILKKYDTRPIVSADKAFRFVEEVYKEKTENVNPRLEFAELQYKGLEIDGQPCLYPVWVFGVAEYDAEWGKMDIEGNWANQWLETGDYYYYYVLDAFNGELLLEPKLEKKHGFIRKPFLH